jgi:hypothetical protein
MEAWAPLKQLLGGHPAFLDRAEIRRLAGATTDWLRQDVAEVFPEKSQEFVREADAILELLDKPAEVRIALVGSGAHERELEMLEHWKVRGDEPAYAPPREDGGDSDSEGDAAPR